MFKPVHNASGYLLENISNVATVLMLDLPTITLLASVLGTGGVDHTYLAIGTAPLMEIVRVNVVDLAGTVQVTRAQDLTTGRTFSAGAVVRYVLAAAAVADIVDETVNPNNVDIVAGNNITVVEFPTGTFTVSTDPLQLTSADGTVTITGTYPELSVDVERGAFGCCD